MKRVNKKERRKSEMDGLVDRRKQDTVIYETINQVVIKYEANVSISIKTPKHFDGPLHFHLKTNDRSRRSKSDKEIHVEQD